MLRKDQKIAIYMEGDLDGDYGKMGFGVMRYTENPIVCVIDSSHAGKTIDQVVAPVLGHSGQPFNHPIVSSVEQAAELGAEVLILGSAPSGGRIPPAWKAPLLRAIELKMSIVNGLHDKLTDKFDHLLDAHQWVWDVRQPTFTPNIGTGQAANLKNKRVLLVGTDMTIGKMTAGLEIYKWVHEMGKSQGISSKFIATGQIGITITGQGIPLDGFKVDHACGAVETMVMAASNSDIVFIEGQGSLLHPGSSATLSLMRGSCPTHLIMCHRAGMKTLRNLKNIKIPPLKEFIELNEALVSVCGALTNASTIGIALNTSLLSAAEAKSAIASLQEETALPVTDVVRFGAEKLANLLLNPPE